MIDPANLPDFQRPPAVETLLGFYFEPLKGWTTPNFGLFWQAIRKEYPRVEVQPSITEQGLKLELETQKARLQIRGEVPVRWRYFHKSGETLIQIQSDTFIQNWRKGSEGAYLHYGDLRPNFERMWNRYLKFLRENQVRLPEVRECEVTYVNYIDKGMGWNSLKDLPEVITAWSGKTSEGFLPTPEIVSMDIAFPIRDKSGRLRVMLEPGIREGKQTLQLTLMARCKPDSSSTPDLLMALDVGREWVVRGFADITAAKMHSVWGKTERPRRPK